MPRRTQRERTESTRQALVEAATRAFGDDGYRGAAAAAVARRAGVTSGALYHHFSGKRDLFRAAVEATQAALAGRVAEAATAGQDPWERLELGVAAYLAACRERSVRRLVLVDGPSVLGRDEWRQLDASHHLRPLRAALAAAMRAGLLERRPPEPLARILLGALSEAGLVADAEREETEAAVLWLLGRLRRPPDDQTDPGKGPSRGVP